jgi:two-component system OmpR family sensor kinase
MTSIRRRLLIVLIGAILVVGAVATAVTYHSAQLEIDALFDYQLRQVALAARDHAVANIGGQVVPFDPEQDFVIQAWGESGVQLYLSHRTLPLPLGALRGLDTVKYNGEDWRVFSLVSGNETVQVAQPMRLRRAMARDAALRVLWPIVLVIPLLAIAVWLSVTASLRPLAAVTRAIGTRDAGALTPLPLAELPSEIAPTVEALNGMLVRVAAALERERRFTADAAHELRTPLTALTLQAQLAERAPSEAERAEALTELRSGVARATRVVEQLLAAARAAPDSGAQTTTDISLDRMAQAACDTLQNVARAKAVTLALARCEPAVVRGRADAVRALLDNLLDNAIRYNAEGGSVTVSVWRDGARVLLEVADTGPGIPEGERTRVFERFYRLAGADVPGTGLGLAIVKQVAEGMDATVALAAGEGGKGLIAKVNFPGV